MNLNSRIILRDSILLILGIVLGVLTINQYQATQQVIALTSRDTTVSLVRQLHLVVSANRDLKNEISNLTESLTEIQTGRNAREVARKAIERYRLLAGEEATEGKGLNLSLDLALQPIWLVDLVNELYIRGAEKIALNGILLTDHSSFALSEGVPYLNANIILNTPYTLQVIGDQTTLMQGLTKRGGILDRLKEQFPGSEDKSSLEAKDLVQLPSKQIKSS